MRNTQEHHQPTEQILERIDAIVQELQELRQVILTQTRPGEENLAAQLYGALGQGTWDEYDPQLDSQQSRS